MRQANILILLAVLLTADASCAFGQTGVEKTAIQRMNEVAAAWRGAVAARRPLIHRCGNDSWSVYRLTNDTQVSVDVRRTDSIMNPLRGVITLVGYLDSNSGGPGANGFLEDFGLQKPRMACYRSVDEAMNAQASADFAPMNGLEMVFSMEAYYDISDTSISLTGGNKYFSNAILTNALELPQNAKTWSDVLVKSMRVAN